MKKKALPFVVLGMVLLMSALVYATTSVTITSPTAAQTVRGTAVEVSGTWVLNSGGGSDALSTYFLNITLDRAGDNICTNSSLSTNTTWSCKVNFDALSDNSSMNINVTIGNLTTSGGAEKGNASTVTIANDNTAPEAKFASGQSSTARIQGDLLADCSASTDNIDSDLSYRINLIKPDGTNATTDITTSLGTFRGADMDVAGSYTLACAVADNEATSTSSPTGALSAGITKSIIVTSNTASPQVLQEIGAVQKPKDNTTVILIIAVAGFLLIMGGGKKLF